MRQKLTLFSALLLACEQPTTSPPAPRGETEMPPAAVSLPLPSAPTEKLAEGFGVPDTKPRGASQEEETVPRDRPRVFAMSRNVWIRSGPSTEFQWLGFLHAGGSVPVREGPERPGPGCSKVWVPVEPRGYVCVEGEVATKDPDNPTLGAVFRRRPRLDTPFPHHYALVQQKIRRFEWLPGAPLPGTKDAAWTALPPGLSERRTQMVGRSAIAYSDSLEHEGQTYLLLPDFSVVRKQDVEPVAPVEFQGISLTGTQKLLLAFFRGKDRPSYRRQADGTFLQGPTVFRRLSHVPLEEEFVESSGTKYHRVRDSEDWVSSREAVIPKSRLTLRAGPSDDGKRATVLEVSILGGYLIAFENGSPVYVTLISAGRGGVPHPDKDPLETASTPTGTFPIGGKFKTATMESSSTPIVHGDVPWTQNLIGPHAIHTAYWHDDWGMLKSAGCVNVAPKDGKWLFEFTDPKVPEGWHGVRHLSRYGPSTQVVLHD